MMKFIFSGDVFRPYLGMVTTSIAYDKLVHCERCALLTILLALWLSPVAAVIAVTCIGVAYEILQGFTNPWGFSFMDIVANEIGCVVAYWYLTIGG